MEGWAGAREKGASAAKADGRSAVVLITASCAQTLIRHGLHSGLCVSQGHHFGFFPLLFLSLHPVCYFDPGKEELRPLQERGEARLYEGDWLPICHLCREEEVWEKGEGKGETGVALCPSPSTLGVHLGGWKLGPEA